MEAMRDKVLKEIFHRTVQFDRESLDPEKKTVSLSFSSEAPVDRYFGSEILDHSPSSVRMGRMTDGAPLLLQHDPDNQIGVIESARIDADRKGRAVVRFSRSEKGKEIWQDVMDGIRSKVSVGYMVHDLVLESKKGEAEVYRVTDWEPLEASLVSIPADMSVGVGRSKEVTPNPVTGEDTITINTRGAKMDQDKTPSPEELAKLSADAVKADRERTAEIRAYAKRFVGRVAKVDELAEKAGREGWSVERMKGMVADQIADGKPIETPDTEIGMSKKEKELFSFKDLILSQIPGSNVRAEFERKACRTVAEQLGTQPKGFFIPYDIQSRGMDHPDYRQFFPKQRRDLVTTSSASADYLVGDNLYASSFIELLRNKMRCREAGVKQLSGLVGNVLIPRQLTGATAVWCTEATGINSESTQTFDQVSLVPNEVGAYTEISRKLLQQATPGVDALVQSDLAVTLALARDHAILHGAGTAEPTGIAITSSIGAFNGAGLTWEDVVDAWKDVATGNADVSTMAWMANPDVVAVLLSRPKVSGQSAMLMADNFTMLGYRVLHTNQVNSGYMFFGDFSQVIEGEWGVLDMLVNPYILDKEGMIRITAYQSVDVGVRHAAAFSMASSIT
jgi:HK97 family phage major capsid protein